MPMTAHQCARFSSSLKLSHEWAATRIGGHLLDTLDKELACKARKEKGLKCFVATDFIVSWNAKDSLNPCNILSRTGFPIACAGIPAF